MLFTDIYIDLQKLFNNNFGNNYNFITFNLLFNKISYLYILIFFYFIQNYMVRINYFFYKFTI